MVCLKWRLLLISLQACWKRTLLIRVCHIGALLMEHAHIATAVSAIAAPAGGLEISLLLLLHTLLRFL